MTTWTRTPAKWLYLRNHDVFDSFPDACALQKYFKTRALPSIVLWIERKFASIRVLGNVIILSLVVQRAHAHHPERCRMEAIQHPNQKLYAFHGSPGSV